MSCHVMSCLSAITDAAGCAMFAAALHAVDRRTLQQTNRLAMGNLVRFLTGPAGFSSSGPHPSRYLKTAGVFTGGKWAGREADYSYPSADKKGSVRLGQGIRFIIVFGCSVIIVFGCVGLLLCLGVFGYYCVWVCSVIIVFWVCSVIIVFGCVRLLLCLGVFGYYCVWGVFGYYCVWVCWVIIVFGCVPLLLCLGVFGY